MKAVWSSCLLLLAIGLPGCDPDEILRNAKPRVRDKPIDHNEEYGYNYPKVILLDEEFDDNSRGWQLENASTQYSMDISGSVLTIDARDNVFRQNNINMAALKEMDDFEIEARLVIVSSSSYFDFGQANALHWGLATTSPKRWLYYGLDNRDVAVSIGAFDGKAFEQEYIELNKVLEGRAYYKDDYNIIMVRKVKNSCYYFINGEFIKKKEALPFYGSRIGFGVGDYAGIKVDYLKVSRLTVN